MLMQATKKYIDSLRNSELSGKIITDFKQREEIGLYMKRGANWSYRIFAVIHENNLYIVATAQNSIL